MSDDAPRHKARTLQQLRELRSWVSAQKRLYRLGWVTPDALLAELARVFGPSDRHPLSLEESVARIRPQVPLTPQATPTAPRLRLVKPPR